MESRQFVGARRNRSSWISRNLDIPKYWRQEVAGFGETWGRFDGLRVLDSPFHSRSL
jgi:hypothetical protein